MKDIAILITCHNRREKTINCLRSLKDSLAVSINKGKYKVEIYIVDDGSTDNTSLCIKSEFPEIFLIQGNGKLFWNRGMYLAWISALKRQEYDFYLWLNDDIILFSNAIQEVIDASTEAFDRAILVGSTCSKKDNILTYGGIRLPNHKVIPDGKLQLCDTFNGNFVLIPKYVYKKVGVIDKLYHHAIGDLDYGLRAKKAGIKSYVAKKYIGTCERHEQLPSWCLPGTPFLKRVKSLYSPLGCSQPYYFFRYELRHFGLVKAAFHFFTIHLRLTFPSLWN